MDDQGKEAKESDAIDCVGHVQVGLLETTEFPEDTAMLIWQGSFVVIEKLEEVKEHFVTSYQGCVLTVLWFECINNKVRITYNVSVLHY